MKIKALFLLAFVFVLVLLVSCASDNTSALPEESNTPNATTQDQPVTSIPIGTGVVETTQTPETTDGISPEEIDGLIVWFDAASLNYEEGGAVVSWENKAEKGLGNAIQGNKNAAPTFTASGGVNKTPGVYFQKKSYLEIEDSTSLSFSDFTILTVVRPDTIAPDNDANQIFSKIATSAPYDHTWYFNIGQNGGLNFGWKSASGNYMDYRGENARLVAKEVYILAGMKSGARDTLYINGACIGEMTAPDTDVAANQSPIVIGGNPQIAQSMNGVISEILMFDRGLEDWEMNQLEKYLAKKWGITLRDESDRAEIILSVDGEEIRELNTVQECYKRVLPHGTKTVPTVEATCTIDGKVVDVEVNQAGRLPGTAKVYIPALSKTLTVSFTVAEEEFVNLTAPSLTDVTITDGFWADKLDLYMEKTLIYSFDEFVKQGALRNFQRVTRGSGTPENNPWLDGLLFETITAASDFMALHPNHDLKTRIDGYIETVYRASLSSESGYLSTHAMLEKPGLYFDATGNARWYHDCYNFGCMAEAGVRYYLATGEVKLLFCAVRFAEFLVDHYGYGKINMVPSHSLPEEALLLLYVTLRDTEGLIETLETYSSEYPLSIDVEEYQDLVKFFIENRGNYENRVNGTSYHEYAQDHAYYFDQVIAAGHAVRANLYYTGMAAAGVEFENYTYLETAKQLWNNIVEKQMYITGGVGAHGADEAYGDNYDLPNDGYCETCAQVAMAFFSGYMQNAFEDAAYADILENYLYNGVLGGVGLDGESFYYTQPLNAYGHSRWEWHSCACCPPMFLKLYSRMGTYIYAFNEDTVYINQFISSEATLANGVSISMVSKMPWSGENTVTVTGKDTVLKIRIPSWCGESGFSVTVNGKAYTYQSENGYAIVPVQEKDTVKVNLTLAPRRIYSDENVVYNQGKVALGYGPLVFCVESVDNMAIPGITSSENSFAISPDSTLYAYYDDTLLGGTVVIRFTATYKNASEEGYAIPFFLRANRGTSATFVWLDEEYRDSGLTSHRFLASASSTDAIGNSPCAAFDGDDSTKWIAGSSQMPEYLAVDLGTVYDLARLVLTFDSAQAWKFKLLYSLDGESWQVFNDQSQNTSPQATYELFGNGEGRYFAVEFIETGVGYVGVSELEVYARASNENIAKHKRCGASSSYDLGMSAHAIFDGSLHTRYCPRGESKPQSVVMDLNGEVELSTIKIYFEKHTDWTYKIEISEDGKTFTVYTEETYSGTERLVEKGARARYVRFTVTATTGGVWGSAWEIAIIAEEMPEDIFSVLENRDNK